MKKLLIALVVVFVVAIGFVVADDHINPFTGEEAVLEQVRRVYDVDENGIVDGTDLTVEEFTLMHLNMMNRFMIQEDVDFEEYSYRCGFRRRLGPPVPGDRLPDEPLYGPRRYRR